MSAWAIALLIDPSNVTNSLLRVLVIGALGHSAIIGVRVFYRCIEEIVTFLKSKFEPDADLERVVLYGAGGRCQLFLKEHGNNCGRTIVGLLDDEPSLHFQWVYGYLVPGGIKDLPHLIKRHRITGIVITASLPPAARAAVQELALKHGLHLSVWSFGERKLDGPSLQQSPAPAPGPAQAPQPAVAPDPAMPGPRTKPSVAESGTLPPIQKLIPLKGPG